MYSKQQASQLKQEFWTAFGRYMQPVLSAEGEKINWINYKTGIRHIFFRMHAGKGASIAIEITHPDMDEQRMYFDRFVGLEKLFTGTMGEEWNWVLHSKDENGKIATRIYIETGGINVMNKADWPALISFLKPRIIALDEFWSMVKPGFEV